MVFRKTVAILFSLFTFAAVAQAGESRWIISDFDDTLKIAHSKAQLPSLWNGLMTHKAYTGMSSLYSEILKEGGPEARLNVVSGSPTFLHHKIRKFLLDHDFPFHWLVLKNWLRDKSTYEYKVAAISRIMTSFSGTVVLFGDDNEKDPQVYLQIQKLFPNRVDAIYIHQISSKIPPEGTIPYLTAFDVVYHEAKKGRISLDAPRIIQIDIIRQRDFRRVIPKFAYCPTTMIFSENNGNQNHDWLDQLREEMDQYIAKQCLKRATKSLGTVPGTQP